MTAFYIISFFELLLLNGVVQSATWSATSLLDGQQLYACANDNVILTWNYTFTTGEELADVRWLYNGHSQELVAIFTQGNFLPTPSFSQRVTRVDNAGLTLSNVQLHESGNYSVEVNIYAQAGALHTLLRRTATLHVSEHLVTTDGALQVAQDPDPVYNNATSQWFIQLQCGQFIFQDNPPFNVEWITPLGHVYNSTSFSQGNFYFHIPMPVETGNYVCSIPVHLAARACLHGNLSQSRVAVRVESVEARLLLLEKENSDLKNKLAMTALQTSHNQEVQQLNSQLQQTQGQLLTITTDLQTRLGKLEYAERNQVAFHATGLATPEPPVASMPLVFNNCLYNLGNAYNSSTGYFTAPYSGVYFFIAKTATAVDDKPEYHSLVVEGLIIDTAYTSKTTAVLKADLSPVHGVVHLTQGQRAYVTSRSLFMNSWINMYHDPSVSTFTGFLLSRDP